MGTTDFTDFTDGTDFRWERLVEMIKGCKREKAEI